MSTSTLAITRRRTFGLSRAFDYVELTKPKIAVLILMTVAVAGYVARWGQPETWPLIHALLGTLLVAASASSLNQWLEQRRDALMERTADRPLPAGRLTGAEVLAFGAVSSIAGVAYLALAVNWTTALLGALTWVLYVAVYTPLKSRTTLNTAVGAVAGALPVLMGWSAAGAAFDLRATALFCIVFLWQFPHFMAIAWIYRRQYDRGGMKMLTVVDPTGRRAGVQAVLAALALLPVSFVPALLSPGASLYVVAAFALGVGQLACAIAFCAKLDETAARRLLRASLIYLPALLALLMFVPFF
jgi:protoheme IX farnesyltransferase